MLDITIVEARSGARLVLCPTGIQRALVQLVRSTVALLKLARVSSRVCLGQAFVRELMAGTGPAESIISAEKRRGKKLWFTVVEGL
uniref:Uncharacterized protein n=1 Tax=Vespula pensylvanica TaxID=30213 RepID=A0A834KC77_VESPE|nr:hypothetical protein H0235_015515 [Vespula pensylvanica]